MSALSEQHIRVAVSALQVGSDAKQSLCKMLEILSSAAQTGVQIICFPEYSLSQISASWVDPSESIALLKAASKEYQVWCIFGADSGDTENRKNSIYLLNPEGDIQYRYDKVHLWHSEKEIYQAGEVARVIDIGIARIAIISCWDMAYPRYVADLADQGAEIIFCPSYLSDYEIDGESLQTLPLARAFENRVYFILCDAVSDDTLSISMICHPLGVRQQTSQTEEVMIGSLDLAELSSLKAYYLDS